MNPVSPADLQSDFQELIALFQSGLITSVSDAELMIMVAPRQTLPQLLALGWLAEKPVGRWSRLYVPAGALALRLSPRTSHREPA